MKIVGHRTSRPSSPLEALRRAEALLTAANELAPAKRSRGFVVKAKTRESYEAWKRDHKNPRFW